MKCGKDQQCQYEDEECLQDKECFARPTCVSEGGSTLAFLQICGAYAALYGKKYCFQKIASQKIHLS